MHVFIYVREHLIWRLQVEKADHSGDGDDEDEDEVEAGR